MNLLELAQTRTKISLNSILKDPTVTPSLKQTLTSITQHLTQQSLTISILQQQLSQKVSSSQLNYSLCNKLSIGQFLQYFNKFQKIFQNLQKNQKKIQENLYNFDSRNQRKFREIQENVLQLGKQWERRKKIVEIQEQSVKNQLKQLNKKIERINKDKSKYQQQNQLKTNKINTNISEIFNQIKQMQKYQQQIKINITQIMNNFSYEQQSNRYNYGDEYHPPKELQRKQLQQKFQKYVTFNQLRSVLSQLQCNLSTSLNKYFDKINVQKQHQYLPNFNKQYLHQDHNQYYDPNNQTDNDEFVQNRLMSTFNPNLQNNFINNLAEQNVYHNSISVAWKWSNNIYNNNNNIVSFLSKQCQNSIFQTHIFPQYSNILIKKQGFYQIRCGLIPIFPIQLSIKANYNKNHNNISNSNNSNKFEVLACHQFHQNHNNNNNNSNNNNNKKSVCRVVMLYFYVQSDFAQISVECRSIQNQNKDKLEKIEEEKLRNVNVVPLGNNYNILNSKNNGNQNSTLNNLKKKYGNTHPPHPNQQYLNNTYNSLSNNNQQQKQNYITNSYNNIDQNRWYQSQPSTSSSIQTSTVNKDIFGFISIQKII